MRAVRLRERRGFRRGTAPVGGNGCLRCRGKGNVFLTVELMKWL